MSAHQRPKIANLLALSVLSVVAERPMYPYQLAAVLRSRGGHGEPEVKWGTLYTVVRQLAAHGLVEAIATSRQGRRPRRTVYRITDPGRKELEDWVRELVATPERVIRASGRPCPGWPGWPRRRRRGCCGSGSTGWPG